MNLSEEVPTLLVVDYDDRPLRERHAAWRLLRAGNATLILSFLGDFFVEANRGASSASEVAAALDDQLYALNAALDRYRGGPIPEGPTRVSGGLGRLGRRIPATLLPARRR